MNALSLSELRNKKPSDLVLGKAAPGEAQRGGMILMTMTNEYFCFALLLKGFGNAKTSETGETKLAYFWIESVSFNAGRRTEYRSSSEENESHTTGCASLEKGQGNAHVRGAFGGLVETTKRSLRLVGNWVRAALTLQCNGILTSRNAASIPSLDSAGSEVNEGFDGRHLEISGGLTVRRIQIGAKVVASNNTFGSALNGNDGFRWHLFISVYPVPDVRLFFSDAPSEFCLGADDFNRPLECRL